MTSHAPSAGQASGGGVEGLYIHPPAASWAAMVAEHFKKRSAPERRFREELGLASDRPVIMSGHQAQVWHPGILAKAIAAQVSAVRAGGQSAWVVVDQDDNDPFEVGFPVRQAPGAGPGERFARETSRDRAMEGWPSGLRPAQPSPGPITPEAPGVPALPSVRHGLARIHDALVRHGGAASAARQVAAAVAELAPPALGSSFPKVLFATDLARTGLFAELVGLMRADPGRCVEAYNHAVAVSEDAGIPMLAAADSHRGPELPMWRLKRSPVRASRERVFAGALAEIPVHELAPRALFMTALLRLGACELFIHGTGGGGVAGSGGGRDDSAGYDRIMERWIRGWLGGEAAARLAPSATVTATLRLDFGVQPVTRAAASTAVWRAHNARHNPAALGDAGAAARKQELVRQIRDARSRGEHPRRQFAELQSLLRAYRADHAPQIESLAAEASVATNRLAEAEVLSERTWPFPLYPPEQLTALREAIAAQFAGPAS